jgi:hypothetical protein
MSAEPFALSPDLERKKIIPLQQGAELQGTSVDTLKRNHPDKIIKLSKRRLGIRLEQR